MASLVPFLRTVKKDVQAVAHNATHNPVTNFVGHQIQANPNVQTAIALGARGVGAPVALPRSTAQTFQQAGQQFVARPAAQVATTIAPRLVQNGTFHPGNRVEKAIFGDTPVQSIPQGIKTNYQQHANLPTPLRAGLAGLYGASQVANDIPLASSAIKGAKTATKLVEPKFNGLKSNQVIMDTRKLDTLHNAREILAAGKADATARNAANDGLHQIKSEHGLDFISGTPASRVQRISQYLEQNGEAIPQKQAHQVKVQDFRNKSVDLQNKYAPGMRVNAVNDKGESVGLNGKPLKTTVVKPDGNFPANAPIESLTHGQTLYKIQSLENRLQKPAGKYTNYLNNQLSAAKGRAADFESGRLTDSASATPTKPQPELSAPQVAVTLPSKSPVSAIPDRNSLPNNTPVALNTGRLNLQKPEQQMLSRETQDTIGRLSNQEVQDAAKSAGLDTRTHTPEQTRQIIAQQLNTRQEAVSLVNQARQTANVSERAELIKRAAERGRTSREQGTDIARQLQARKIIANELDSPEQRIFKLLDNAGVNPEVYSKRLAEVDFNNTKDVVKAYREMVPAKAKDWLDVVRYNSMLSSPLTQAVNIFGNAQNVALVAPIEKTLRGTIDAVGGLFGKERQYAAGEGGAYAAGVAKNIVNASHEFVDALRGSGKYANPDFEDFNIPLAQGGAKGAAYNTLSAPMRVLDGMDKFFRALADAGEEGALKARENAGIAINGNRQAIKDSEQAYRVFQTELGTPGQGAINNALDEFAGKVMQLRNSKNPLVSLPAKFTVPFVKTVNNIAKQGIVDYSPLGFANLKGNTDKTTAITRAIMGSAVFGSSAALIGQGRMTWAEPRDPDERARFRKEGKQPYSIHFGSNEPGKGYWVNFSKLTPAVAFPMAMTAALHDALENGKTDESTVDKVLQSVAKYGNFLADQSYAKSVGDTLGAIGGDTEAVAQAVSNNVQQVVPFRALTGWVARLSDNTERKVDTTQGYIDQQVQSLMQQYPGLREKTMTRDYKGTPIAANNPVLNALSPVKITKDRGVDPVDKALDEAKKVASNEPKLSKSEEAELSKAKQAAQTAGIRNFISSDDYAVMTPQERAKAIKNLNNKIGRQQTGDYKSSHGYTAGTNSKPDFTKANDTEYKYELDQYNQKKKDGKLSTAQDIQAQSKLAKQKVGADYSKNIRELYGLTKPQLASYLNTSRNGKEEYAQLQSYDQALKAAGITTTLKFKNGLTTGRTASSGRRRGSSKLRVTSLPKVRTASFKSPKVRYKTKAPKRIAAGRATYKTKAITPHVRTA